MKFRCELQVIINVVASLQGEQSFQNGQPYALHTVVSLNNKPIHQEDKKFNAARPPSKDFLKVAKQFSQNEDFLWNVD